MNETMDTLRNSRPVTVGDRKISVRGLPWGKTLGLLKSGGEQLRTLAMNEGGEIGLDLGKLPELIASCDELATGVISGATELSRDEIAELSLEEALEILDAAVELSVTPKLLERGKALGGRLGSLFPNLSSRAQSAAKEVATQGKPSPAPSTT